jgi:hypothetical protein
MRKLSKRQKKAIEDWFNANWKGDGSVYSIDQMPESDSEKILKMNDHETFWQNADRFIGELALEKMYGSC